MSLDKAIAAGKERRKPYYRSGRNDRTCRPHGTCPYCRGNREHSTRVRQARADGTADALPEISRDTLQESKHEA